MNDIAVKETRDPKRILVVMPTWVGDVVMTTPALRAIRERFRGAHITLLIRPNARPVIEPGPWMDDIIEWNPQKKGFGKIADPFRIAGLLRKERFDWAILFSNAFRMALVARLAGIPRRMGYDRDGRGMLLTEKLAPRREGNRFAFVSTVKYYNELVQAIGCELPDEKLELCVAAEDEGAVVQRLERWKIADSHPLVVINPGASFGISKLWLPERYAEVADMLVRERDAKIVITCGPGEESLAHTIAENMESPSFVVDNPRGTLGQLKALLGRCDLLLNNDTGPRHIAKALGRPVVTVFGSTHTEWTHTDYDLEREVKIEVDCGPCQEKQCKYDHHKCMTGVTADMVFRAACELLDQWSLKKEQAT